MPAFGSDSLPEFRDWSIAAVRLLQGVVYADDNLAWDLGDPDGAAGLGA